MQRNALDHWIRRRVLLCRRIYADSFPYIPHGARQLPGTGDWRMGVECPSEEDYSLLLARLRRDQIRHEPVVQPRPGLLARILEPHPGDSITCLMFWRAAKLGAGAWLLSSELLRRCRDLGTLVLRLVLARG